MVMVPWWVTRCIYDCSLQTDSRLKSATTWRCSELWQLRLPYRLVTQEENFESNNVRKDCVLARKQLCKLQYTRRIRCWLLHKLCFSVSCCAFACSSVRWALEPVHLDSTPDADKVFLLQPGRLRSTCWLFTSIACTSAVLSLCSFSPVFPAAILSNRGEDTKVFYSKKMLWWSLRRDCAGLLLRPWNCHKFIIVFCVNSARCPATK